jgi:hypothetical protein
MAFLGCPFLFIHVHLRQQQAIEETMIKRTIKIIKKLDKTVIPLVLPAVNRAELGESEVRDDNATAVNKWISERRENDRVEKADSTSKIHAWRKLHGALEVKES